MSRERGIPFSAPMVRAILDGRKTVTRRMVKPGRGYQASWCDQRFIDICPRAEMVNGGVQLTHPLGGPGTWVACPYGVPGDRLYVREAWRVGAVWDDLSPAQIGMNLEDARAAMIGGTTPILYLADEAVRHPRQEASTWGRYRHARFMPRWASRLTLDVVGVRVERLHEITNEDALREGIDECVHYDGPRDAYRELWNSINGAGAWDANPWVWVVNFKRVT